MGAQMINRPFNELMGSYTFVPFQSLFSDGSNEAAIDAYVGHEGGGHMYGSFVFYTYLADLLGYSDYIGNLYNGWDDDKNPLEHVKKELFERGLDFADTFTDFAARMLTFDIPYGDDYQKMAAKSLAWMQGQFPDLAKYDFSIARTHDAKGTGRDWLNVPDDEKPAAYAYNAYKLSPTKAGKYRVQLAPTAKSFEVAMKAKLVVFNPESKGREYIGFDLKKTGRTTKDVEVKDGDDLYLLVAVVPSPIPADSDRTRFAYRYRIFPL
jgi:hypothetical protein